MKIVLDAGHGLNTAGKQTWDIDGSFMHEHEFNRAVANYLKSELAEHEVIFSHWTYGDIDRSLQKRCDIANDFNADIFISIHANAAPCSDGVWHEACGIETYHYPTSSKGEKLAEHVQNALIKGTGRKDRGILPKKYDVLRHTHMPAILVECGFMTNKNEAKLLTSDSYRRDIAFSIAEGIRTFDSKIIYYDEIDPLDLHTWKGYKRTCELTHYDNFINGMFFSSLNTLYDWCIYDEKVLSYRKPWNRKPKGTLVVCKNGTVLMAKVKDVNPKGVHLAVQGVSLYGDVLANMKEEGWLSDVNRPCVRNGIGYLKNKIIIITIYGTLEDLQAEFEKLNCYQAIGLDSGGSTARCRKGKMLIDTIRKMRNIIYWRL